MYRSRCDRFATRYAVPAAHDRGMTATRRPSLLLAEDDDGVRATLTLRLEIAGFDGKYPVDVPIGHESNKLALEIPLTVKA